MLQPKKGKSYIKKGYLEEKKHIAKIKEGSNFTPNSLKMETKPLSSMRVSPSANIQNATLKTAINAAAKKGGLFKKKG